MSHSSDQPVTPRRSSWRRLPWWLGVFALLAFVASTAALITVHMASGVTRASGLEVPTNFDPYVHRPDGRPADPINLIFLGADADKAATAFQAVLGWPAINANGMTFIDQGQSRPTARQFGLDLGGGSRFHVRIEADPAASAPIPPDPAAPGHYALAAVHRDDSVSCGHIGEAFDDVRNMVGEAFARAGYSVTRMPLGNTTPGQQCDGSFSAGDGIVLIIDLGGS